jgi:DNA transformation protein and related proteins
LIEPSTPIELLHNLGPASSRWLRDAGITTIGDLQRAGPVAAYRLVQQQQPHVSLNLLWSLAAGLQERDWRELDESAKQRLRQELNAE